MRSRTPAQHLAHIVWPQCLLFTRHEESHCPGALLDQAGLSIMKLSQGPRQEGRSMPGATVEARVKTM